LSAHAAMAEFALRRYSGADIAPHVPALAKLRIAVFREFPYLYDGDEAYERRYLQTYVDSPRSLVALVYAGDALVGATTGLPMDDETEEFKRPFRAGGYDTRRVFYCGESVLDPRYRGRGIYRHLFEARERHAQALGGFAICTFCCVQRPADHPLRPHGYAPLDAVWRHFGYAEQPQLSTEYVWKDIDEPQPSAKLMRFWLKRLPERAQ